MRIDISKYKGHDSDLDTYFVLENDAALLLAELERTYSLLDEARELLSLASLPSINWARGMAREHSNMSDYNGLTATRDSIVDFLDKSKREG